MTAKPTLTTVGDTALPEEVPLSVDRLQKAIEIGLELLETAEERRRARSKKAKQVT